MVYHASNNKNMKRESNTIKTDITVIQEGNIIYTNIYKGDNIRICP